MRDGDITHSCARLIVDPTSTTLAQDVLSDIDFRLHAFEQAGSELCQLSEAIRRGLGFLIEGRIPVGQAIPYVIAAASSLDRYRGQHLNKSDRQSIDAACFELQSIFPMDGEAKTKMASPDVPLESLTRKR